jgi:hypothetical protein
MLIKVDEDGLPVDERLPASYKRLVQIGLCHLIMTQQAIRNEDGTYSVSPSPYYMSLVDTPKAECYGGTH